MKKNKFIIFLCIFVFIIILFRTNHKETLLYRKANGLYQFSQSKKYKITSLYDINYQTNGKNILLYSDFRNLYSYNTKNKYKKKIINYPNIFLLLDDNSFVILDKNNTLYVIKNSFKRLIEKNVGKVKVIDNHTIIYEYKNNNIIYNISTKRKSIIDRMNSYTFSSNKRNIIIKKNKDYIVFSMKKNKIIRKLMDIDEYLCINRDCSSLYYVKDKKIYSTMYKNEILDKNIYRILYNDNEQLLYSKYENNKYVLYYKDGLKKSIRIDKRDYEFTDVFIQGNKIHYLVGGIFVERTVLKVRKEIGNVSQLIKYNGTLLLLKGDDLYEENKLLVNNIVSSSIKFYNKKIYYLKKTKQGNDLYYKIGNKEKLISHNVYNYIIINGTIYYLSNYDDIISSGELYSYRLRNKLIDKDVTEILSLDS